MRNKWNEPGLAGGQPVIDLIKEYSYLSPVFIETGAGSAITVIEVAHRFDHCWTIEYDDIMHDEALRNLTLEKIPNVTLIRGNSEDILGALLSKIRTEYGDRILLFLDARVSDTSTAIWREIMHWKSQIEDGARIYTLIDNARLFDGHLFPTQNWVRDQADSVGYSYRLRDDVMVLMP